jgi:hypothetical protein
VDGMPPGAVGLSGPLRAGKTWKPGVIEEVTETDLVKENKT